MCMTINITKIIGQCTKIVNGNMQMAKLQIVKWQMARWLIARWQITSKMMKMIRNSGCQLLWNLKSEIIHYRVVVGENKNFSSFAEEIMKNAGVDVCLLKDQNCVDMMENFIKNNKELWNEDIHEIDDDTN